MPNKQRHCIGAATLALIAAGAAGLAYANSGGGGGGHGGGAGHGGGHHGRSHHGRGGTGADYPERWQGNRGWQGGGDGWYSGGFYGGSGRLRNGLLFAQLPWYCERYWWGGAAYFYSDDNYYQWNDSAGAYETVQPPPGLVDQVQTQAPARELFIFPDAGQSNAQLARDRDDCDRWAVAQVGFDPRPASTASSADSVVARRMDYLRAVGACLMGRNYTVE